ncbi:hypothetical protein KR018_004232 [Drosophila ironensis]|nr:hypothetical protein KR018_004232 [Drosophila ironensis]
MKKRCVATVSPSFCRNRIFKLRQWESRHRLEKMRQMQHERRVNNGGRIWTSLFSEVLAREEGQKLICDSCVKSADIENNEVLICPMRNILMCCGGNKWWDRNDERALQIMSKEQSFRFLDKIFE